MATTAGKSQAGIAEEVKESNRNRYYTRVQSALSAAAEAGHDGAGLDFTCDAFARTPTATYISSTLQDDTFDGYVRASPYLHTRKERTRVVLRPAVCPTRGAPAVVFF